MKHVSSSFPYFFHVGINIDCYWIIKTQVVLIYLRYFRT